MLRNDDFERGRREAFEGRMERDRLARIEAEGARGARERLERASPSAPRRSLVDILNGVSTDRARSEAPGLEALEGIRKAQRLGYRTAEDHNRAYARFEKTAAAVQGTGLSYGEARLMNERRGPSGSKFDFHSSDPGRTRGSRFEWNERFDPPRRVPRVKDTAGALHGDGRDRPGEPVADRDLGSDHCSSGAVTAVQADFLLDAARSLIEAVRVGRANFPKGRSDDYGRPKS
jgi:hypothetical protein